MPDVSPSSLTPAAHQLSVRQQSCTERTADAPAHGIAVRVRYWAGRTEQFSGPSVEWKCRALCSKRWQQQSFKPHMGLLYVWLCGRCPRACTMSWHLCGSLSIQVGISELPLNWAPAPTGLEGASPLQALWKEVEGGVKSD